MNIHAPVKSELQVWFTPEEYADAARVGMIIGIPATRQGINELARRENWRRFHSLVDTDTARGGTITRFHINLLPAAVRVDYVSRFYMLNGISAARVQLFCGSTNLSDRARLARDARLAILRLAEGFRRTSKLTVMGADGLFVSIFEAGSVKLPEWAEGAVDELSVRTLQRWRSAMLEGGADALAFDQGASRKGTGLLDSANDGAVRNFMLALIAKQPHLSAEEVRKQCRAEFGDEIVTRNGELKEMPPPRTFQHVLKGLKEENKVLLTKLTDPDRYRSHYMLSGTGALRYITEPNQLWQIDASPVDALCVDGRHTIYVCLDIATRRLVILVSKTPRASAVALLTRKAILARGKPKMIVTDNGSDFVADETQRLFAFLGIDAEQSDPYSPEQKGHVERAIKTFQHKVSPLLPGYVGHNPMDRKAIEGRKSFDKRLGQSDGDAFGVSLTAAELQSHIDAWVDLTYDHTPHSGIGMDGMTPAQKADASAGPIHTVDERALDVLLMPAPGNNPYRVLSKRGFPIGNFYYQTGEILTGTRALIRHDPMDAGIVYAFSEDGGQYLAKAVCAELAGINPVSLLKAARERQAEMMDAALKPVRRELRKLNTGPALIERALQVDRRDAEKRAADSANVVRLPKREEQHSTPALEAALDAATRRPSSEPKPLSAAQRQMHDAVVRELSLQPVSAPAGATPLRTSETPQQRFQRWLDIDRRFVAGEQLASETLVALGEYKAGREWKVQMAMRELEEANNEIGDQAPVSRP